MDLGGVQQNLTSKEQFEIPSSKVNGNSWKLPLASEWGFQDVIPIGRGLLLGAGEEGVGVTFNLVGTTAYLFSGSPEPGRTHG